MSSELKRQSAYGAVLIVWLAGFALARGVPWASAACALAACATVLIYVLRSDEVERALAFKSGFIAFMVTLAATIVLSALGEAEAITLLARELWAVLLAVFLLCWLVYRIRLG
jgi:hypothetical protein